MARVLSGIQPSGDLHLGNYLGALRHWVARPARARRLLLRRRPPRPHPATSTPRCCGPGPSTRRPDLLAAGLDPAVCTLFVQSHVPEHTRLTWLLECTATMGELRRMTQFKDKAGPRGGGPGRAVHLPGPRWRPTSCSTTPTGSRSATTSVSTSSWPASSPSASTTATAESSSSPRPPSPRSGPGSWTSSTPSARCPSRSTRRSGTIGMLDDPDEIERKVRRAVTDTDGEVRYDPRGQARRVEPARAAGRGHRPHARRSVAERLRRATAT